ncbi:MAG TPA: hypothetical protein VNH18_05695 [Bryobacteraceae bacterium]|nr:hypothetical protein [Bryobacteraceae bacterium]
MKTLLAALVAVIALGMPLLAQDAPPDQIIVGGLHYDQQSTPNLSGFVGYGKHIATGTYSYTLIRETSLTLKPKPQLQTSTETGVAVHVGKFGAFELFGLATGGIAAAGSATGTNAGFAGSGGVLATKALSRGWFIGASAWAAYSSIPGAGVSYPVGLVIGWGK